jgi:CRP-like cAMP-binding protein
MPPAIPEETRSTLMPNKMFKKGQIVFCEGDEADGLYYICSGKVQVSRKVDGKPQLLSELGEGVAFGELALISKQPRIATVTAAEDTWVYHVTVKNFDHKMSQVDPLIREVIHLLVAIIRKNAA